MKTLIVALTLSAGLITPVLADECKVGISVYTLNSRFMASLEKAATAKAKSLGCKVVSTDA